MAYPPCPVCRELGCICHFMPEPEAPEPKMTNKMRLCDFCHENKTFVNEFNEAECETCLSHNWSVVEH